MTYFFPIEVTRDDAERTLWAPGCESDNALARNGLTENGEIPSYDHSVILRRCDELNGLPSKALKRDASRMFEALLLETTDADKLRNFAQSLAGRMDRHDIESLFPEELWAFDYMRDGVKS